MGVHYVSVRRGGGTGKIVFGVILAAVFGSAAIASLKVFLSDEDVSLIPLVACAILALAGIGMAISGFRSRKKSVNATAFADDPEQILKMFHEDPDSIQKRVEFLRKQGV